MKTFKVGDKVRVNNKNSSIHNQIGVVCGYDHSWDIFYIDINNKSYGIYKNYLEKIDEEELTRKCLFENADALDTYIGTIDNMVCLSTISNDVSTWSVGTYKGNDCVMPSYARLKESEEKKMKEIKNQKVVDLHFERKKKSLEKAHLEDIIAVEKTDPNRVFVEELKKQFNDYVEENVDKDEKPCFNISLPLTEGCSKTIAELKRQYNDNKKQLEEDKEEILAMLYGCDTYEQEMEILQTYKIVSYNTHYVSMNKTDASETN